MKYYPPKIPFDQSPNYDVDSPREKIGYVFHATLGKFIGARQTLKANPRLDAYGNDIGRASAHLLISEKDNEWVELVNVKDVAWHAGRLSNPDLIGQKALLKNASGNYISPNQYLIGIEFCCGWDVNNNGKVDFSELNLSTWQYEAAAQYIARNFLLYNVPIESAHCVGHTNLTDYKSDNMLRHVQKVLDRALEIVASTKTPETPVSVPPVAPQGQSVCIPQVDIDSLKQSVKNKEVLGLYAKIKKLLNL